MLQLQGILSLTRILSLWYISSSTTFLPSARSVINNFSYALQLHKQPCPSVYVYDLGSDFYGEFGFNYSDYIRRGLDTREIFAKPCSVRGTYESRYHVQFEISRIILYRLFHSKRCRLELDPSKADLFFVPLYPGPYGTIPMLRQCQKQSQFPALRYLTQQTLPFHFMYVNQPELKCWLGKEELIRRPMLEDILRLAYGNVYRHNQTSVADRMKFNKNADNFGPYEHSTQLEHLVQDDVFAPHMVSLPFPSSVHWDKKLPLEDAPWVSAPRVSKVSQRPRRRYLVSFTGSFRNCTYGQVRPHLEMVFRDCPTDLCATALKENEGTFQAKGQQFCSYIYLKMQSVFCVEPGGDNPWRKSFWDSLTAGCIPVIFSPYNWVVAPWHWQAMAREASVYVNATDFVNGRIDLIEMLQAIPRSKVLEMQAIISHYGHQWQWSVDEFKNDAFEITLKGVHQYAKRSSKQKS